MVATVAEVWKPDTEAMLRVRRGRYIYVAPRVLPRLARCYTCGMYERSGKVENYPSFAAQPDETVDAFLCDTCAGDCQVQASGGDCYR